MDGSATNAQIEAAVAAVAGGSAASMFEVSVKEVYSGAANKNNATADGRDSADDYVYITLREPSLRLTKRFYVPAPENGMFLANSEQIDLTSAQFVALTTALTPVLGTFTFSTVAFVEHQDSNEAQQL